METFCKVEGCRFAASHVTCAHVCGTCGATGHGVIECGKGSLMDVLRLDHGTLLPCGRQCCVANCKDIGRHTTAGHQCSHCKQYSHDATECPDALWDLKKRRGMASASSEADFKQKRHVKIQARNKMGWEEHKVFTEVYAGMGCWWFARRVNNWDKIELMYMHSDDWGPYEGVETEEFSAYSAFIHGFRAVQM